MEHSLASDLGCPWPTPASIPSLSGDELHVWCAAVDVDESLAGDLQSMLDEDEQARAGRYLSERHRRRFIACRAAQRLILSTYVGAPASEIEFVYSPLGKPGLAKQCSRLAPRDDTLPLAEREGYVFTERQLTFNVSNSADMALFAVMLDRELGVDVERIRDNLDHAGLAQRFFAAAERDKLRSLPEELRLSGFFDCWTRKEAFLKAIGKGLTYPLDRAVVSVGPQEPCRLLTLDGDAAAAAAWTLVPLRPAPGYVAAIATTGAVTRVQAWRWDWPSQTQPPS